MIRVSGGTEGDCVKFNHTTQNNIQIKIYELFISEIFHLIFLDQG